MIHGLRDGLALGLAAAMVVAAPAFAQSRDDVRAAQAALNDRGYDAGPADGLMGPKTRTAIEAWERATGRETDGVLNDADLAALKAADTDAEPPTTPRLAGERPGAKAVPTERRLPGGQRPPSTIAERRRAAAPPADVRRTPFGLRPPEEQEPSARQTASTATDGTPAPDVGDEWEAEPWSRPEGADRLSANPADAFVKQGLQALSLPSWFTKERFAAFLLGLVVLSFILQRVARRRPDPAPVRTPPARR